MTSVYSDNFENLTYSNIYDSTSLYSCLKVISREISVEPKGYLGKYISEKGISPKDITIKCKKCGIEFVWTIKDQEYYKEKGFFKPSSCKECRKKGS